MYQTGSQRRFQLQKNYLNRFSLFSAHCVPLFLLSLPQGRASAMLLPSEESWNVSLEAGVAFCEQRIDKNCIHLQEVSILEELTE
jgi:hypothetical protein